MRLDDGTLVPPFSPQALKDIRSYFAQEYGSMSQSNFSDLVGVGVHTIYRLENGLYKNAPRMSTWKKIWGTYIEYRKKKARQAAGVPDAPRPDPVEPQKKKMSRGPSPATAGTPVPPTASQAYPTTEAPTTQEGPDPSPAPSASENEFSEAPSFFAVPANVNRFSTPLGTTTTRSNRLVVDFDEYRIGMYRR